MATYLCVKASNQNKSFTAKESKEAGKPYLCVKASNSVGYFPLTTETSTGTKIKVEDENGNIYRIVETYTTSRQITVTTGTSYLTRSSTSGTSYATRSSTSYTSYYTRKSTSQTSYVTRASTSKTTYGTASGTGKGSINGYLTWNYTSNKSSLYSVTITNISNMQLQMGTYLFNKTTSFNSTITQNAFRNLSIIFTHNSSTLTWMLNNVSFKKLYNEYFSSVSFPQYLYGNGGVELIFTISNISHPHASLVSLSFFSTIAVTSTISTGYLTRKSTYATEYKTRSSTSNTSYYTRISTSSTIYLTRSSTSGTSYLTATSSEQITTQ